MQRAIGELVGPTVHRTVSEVVSQLKAEFRALLSPAKRQSKVLLSLREAARRLGIDPNTTLLELIRKGRLRAVTANGKLRVPAAEVDRLAVEGFDSSAVAHPRALRAARPRAEVSPGASIRRLKL